MEVVPESVVTCQKSATNRHTVNVFAYADLEIASQNTNTNTLSTDEGAINRRFKPGVI